MSCNQNFTRTQHFLHSIATLSIESAFRIRYVAPVQKLSLHWRWFLGLTGLLAVLVAVVNLALDITLPPFLFDRIHSDLEREAVLTRAAVASVPADKVNEFAHELSRQTGLRVTIITTNGVVIGESDKPPEAVAQIENHAHRPEVRQARESGIGSATRHSDTIGVDLLYVAVPAGERGFVRVALPLSQIALVQSHVRKTVAVASLIVVLLSLPVVYFLSRRVTGPLEEMRSMAVRVANSDFSQRAPERGGVELQELGKALNIMSAQLEARLRELAAEKSELQATLANMIEGVLVVDAGNRVRLINATLRRQFELTDVALGKTALEVFRSAPLQDLLAKTLSGEQKSVHEMSFIGMEERVFDVAAAPLRTPDGGITGAVVVMHDITRIKQLENIRKEFVANVSHELRTPLSIIKGYVETLLDEQPPDEATSKQFLATIQRHSRRLEALIADLLSISELESQQARLSLAPVVLADAARNVVEELSQRARAKNTTVEVNIHGILPAVRADAQRLHQVLVNLLDNAIKYTPTGSKVSVTAQVIGNEVDVCVADNGPGISPEHLSRIFERFYRVDKARSRELGGTGLGLSIVKHIIQAHGGRVWAESPPTGGTMFHFTLQRE
jgi:two-component system, OmpR family, phosphate regulon sensor histidine kinase PhoR